MDTRFCRFCGKELVRKRTASGEKEVLSRFLSRLTCNHVCGGGLRRRIGNCVVCGNRLTYGRNQTCGDTVCHAFLITHPELADQNRTNTNRKTKLWQRKNVSTNLLNEAISHQPPIVEDQKTTVQQLVERFKIDISGLQIGGGLELTEDARGVDGCQSDVWSHLSRKTTLLRIQSKKDSSVGLEIVVPEGETVKTTICNRVLKGSGQENLCDVFLSWRCSCPHAHIAEYATVDDLPDKPGWHNPCPQCGSAPVKVIYG